VPSRVAEIRLLRRGVLALREALQATVDLGRPALAGVAAFATAFTAALSVDRAGGRLIDDAVPDTAVGMEPDLRLIGVIDAVQQRVQCEDLLDLLVQFQRRELQQPDRLLQLRRQSQVLALADL